MSDLIGIRNNLSKEQREKVNKAIALLVPEAKEVMKNKPSFQTTQNNYGWYMGQLSHLKQIDPFFMIFFANALILAGGNRAGIIAAMKLI